MPPPNRRVPKGRAGLIQPPPIPTPMSTLAAHDEEFHDDIIYPGPIPFIAVHLACFAAIWTGVSAKALAVAAALYVIRMFGVTAGYHRYFSHRSYKTSRAFQFILAFIAQSSAQRGVLWWAFKHRHHHAHSDTAEDVHSPKQRGFFYSHVGWIFTSHSGEIDYDQIPDLAKYPELVWLDRWRYVPAIALGVGCFLFGGWPMLVVGFFWSTVVLYHCTFFINSLAHVHGRQRYVTGDDSRNNWWLAILTMGEGWHNNHHAYQRSMRQGFRWWEVDITAYVLTALSWVGLVWDLGQPPADVVRNERRLGKATLEKVARQLAATWSARHIAERIHRAIEHRPTLAELRERIARGHPHFDDVLTELHLTDLPSIKELRERAETMFAATPSMDAIVARARELLLEAVRMELMPAPTPA